jgi:hypothetical protein
VCVGGGVVSVCVCVCLAAGIQHAMHVQPITLAVARPAVRFPHYLINRTIFEKKTIIEHKMCFDFLYNFCLKKFSQPKNNWARYDQKMYIGRHVKYPLLFVTFQWNLNVLDRFSKNTQKSNFMKIGPVGAELHADGRTDRHDEAHSQFSQFTVVLTNRINSCCYEDGVINVISAVA